MWGISDVESVVAHDDIIIIIPQYHNKYLNKMYFLYLFHTFHNRVRNLNNLTLHFANFAAWVFWVYFLWNTIYKVFISFKDIYWPKNQIYAISQYFQCWPFFSMTAVCSGMLDISLWAKSWLMETHSWLISAPTSSQCMSLKFVLLP